jgi:hypothetical protein
VLKSVQNRNVSNLIAKRQFPLLQIKENKVFECIQASCPRYGCFRLTDGQNKISIPAHYKKVTCQLLLTKIASACGIEHCVSFNYELRLRNITFQRAACVLDCLYKQAYYWITVTSQRRHVAILSSVRHGSFIML